jgi:hypothetical protein
MFFLIGKEVKFAPGLISFEQENSIAPERLNMLIITFV